MEPTNNQQRKIAAITLLVLSVVVVVIAVREVSQSVGSLTSGGVSDEPLVLDRLELANQQLRAQDTDGDGLNDYDELYLYNSSPYLVDSDSDGIDDKTEIDSGDDPNCPGAQDCYGSKIIDGEPFKPNVNVPVNQPLSPGNASLLKELLPNNPTADDIRALILSQGASEASVSGISDEELLENYSRSYNAL